MKPIPAVLALLLLSAGPAPAAEIPSPSTPPAPSASPDQAGEALFRRVDPSVVAVQHEYAGGSGVILTPDGYILTNGHVVAGQDDEDPQAVAKRITVSLSDDRKFRATVIGHCLDPDVALIKIQPDQPLTPAELGDSDTARSGQRCYALGMPTGLKRTLTAGILSNTERTDLGTFTCVLQTDAAINPGNSGGPLFNEQGQVLGLNTYAGGGQNLGFTIPINVVKTLKDHFLKQGRFRRAVLPTLRLQELYEEMAKALRIERGILVDDVAPGSEAERAGFASGDVIMALDGAPVGARSRTDLLRFQWDLVTREVGSRVAFTVLRPVPGAEPRTVEIPAELREDDPAPSAGHQVGEIPQRLYDELGLGVQRIVPLSRILYNLAPDAGVLVTTVKPNSPAQKAGMSQSDIVTTIEGEAVADPEAFQACLGAQLAARRKAIRLTLRRDHATVPTAIAPYYSLDGKRVALRTDGKDPEWLALVRLALLEAGAEVVEGEAAPPAPPDCLLLVAGAEPGALADEATAVLVRDAVGRKKVVAAMGAAALAAVRAEPALLERKMTTAEELADQAMALKANYTGKPVESDAKLVTTTAFDKPTVKAFLQALKTALLAP